MNASPETVVYYLPTLDKKRGNAIDIASLEIALLRAARIPARYQFGTIELPAEQVMNWVGGVSKAGSHRGHGAHGVLAVAVQPQRRRV